jgi:hypothetical protein
MALCHGYTGYSDNKKIPMDFNRSVGVSGPQLLEQILQDQ